MPNQNGNANCGKTWNEWRKQVFKAKQGWAVYFKVQERLDNVANVVTNNQPIIQQINNNEEIDINHLKEQFKEMYDKLRSEVDCPVCMEVMTKDTIQIPTCGHLICKSCYDTIRASPRNQCCLCNRKYPAL